MACVDVSNVSNGIQHSAMWDLQRKKKKKKQQQIKGMLKSGKKNVFDIYQQVTVCQTLAHIRSKFSCRSLSGNNFYSIPLVKSSTLQMIQLSLICFLTLDT